MTQPMDEISNTANNALVEQSDGVPIPASGKTLYITESTPDFDYKNLLGQFVQAINMSDILAKVEAGTQYVVQIPAEFQKAYESGEYFIMQNAETGKMWPSLMKVAENGRNQVVTPLPIAEQAMVQGNPIQDLSMGYMDAIPADFMKSEQQKITKELNSVEHEIQQHSLTFDQITKNLSYALEMLNDCGEAYRNASDKIKRLMNQAIFSKIYVVANDEIPLGIEGELRPPFDSILAPTIGGQSETNITLTIEDSNVAKSRILLEPGCGHFADNSTFMRSYSKFFKDKSSSNKLLVECDARHPNSSPPSKRCISRSVIVLLSPLKLYVSVMWSS